MEDTISDGMIQGGWGYVWTVYAVTWGALILYGGWAIVQARRVKP